MCTLETAYYTIVFISIACYFCFLWVFRLPWLTFSTVNYLLAIVLCMLPGYRISINGLNPDTSRGFDVTLYLLYLTFAVSLTSASLAGQYIGSQYVLTGSVRCYMWARWRLLAFGIACYAILYYLWVPTLPLANLLSGAASLSEAATERIKITHQLGSLELGVPFAFRFWRSILQLFPVVLSLLYLIAFQDGVKKSRVILSICVASTFLCLTFTLEKAGAVEFLFALIIAGSVYRASKANVRVALGGFAAISLCLLMLIEFMGATPASAVDALIQRCEEQTASIYIQIEYVREHGFLGWRGIPLPMGGFLLGRDYFIDLASLAFSELNPSMAARGVVGSAGGLSLAELYFAFGWICVPIFAIFVFGHSWLDLAWRAGVYQKTLESNFRRVAAAFYIFGMTSLSMTFVSSVFLVFALPIGLSARGMFIFALYAYFVKITSLRVRRR